jgi:hypothetical protein
MVIITPNSRTPSGEPPWQPHKWNNRSNSQIKASHNCYSYMLNDLHNIPRIHGKPQPGAYANLKILFSNNMRLSCKQVRIGVMADNPNIKVLNCKKGLTYKCKPGHYKGFMMVSPGQDFHFARQDNRMIAVYRKMHKDCTKNGLCLPKSKTKLIKLYLDYIKKTIPNIESLTKKLYPNCKTPKKRLEYIFKVAHTWSHKPGASNATDKDASGELILNPLKANWNYSNIGGINYSNNCCFFEIPSNYTENTYSTGYSFFGSKVKDNPKDRRTNISKVNSIDQQYEALLIMITK